MVPISGRIRGVIGLMAAVLVPSAAPGDEPRRPIAEVDLLRFARAADPRVSPDGSLVAFVRSTVDRDRDDYETSIWAVPTSGARTRNQTRSNAPEA